MSGGESRWVNRPTTIRMNPPQHPIFASGAARCPLASSRAQIITGLVFWAIMSASPMLTGPIIGRGVIFQVCRFAMEALFWTALLVTVVAFYSATKYSRHSRLHRGADGGTDSAAGYPAGAVNCCWRRWCPPCGSRAFGAA